MCAIPVHVDLLKNQENMKTLLATFAVAISGAAFAAPTTLYFAGSTSAYQSIDASTNAWVSSATGRQFSGSVTIDGSQGTLTSGMASPWVQEAFRLTDSRCPVVSDGSCYDGTPASSNLLGFSLSLDGASYIKWNVPADEAVEISRVGKSQWADGSEYSAVVASSTWNVLATTSQGERVHRAFQSLGLTLAGDAQAMGDLLDLALLPSLGRVDLPASVLRFSSGAYTCIYRLAGCEDLVNEADSVVFEGRLGYLGLVPQAVSEVSEPETAALLLMGLFALTGWRRKSPRV